MVNRRVMDRCLNALLVQTGHDSPTVRVLRQYYRKKVMGGRRMPQQRQPQAKWSVAKSLTVGLSKQAALGVTRRKLRKLRQPIGRRARI